MHCGTQRPKRRYRNGDDLNRLSSEMILAGDESSLGHKSNSAQTTPLMIFGNSALL